ncbi:beta-galactosidase family protein [Kineosporia sp. NBRC 101731]|uniref:glycoside hydrolase family 35 protein n=1 Tax=Kineosporia sp. NBRC 101731 TaxID=3032199 RepID=UPI0024A553C1|nr:beta-galactosidase family protein [Kineosporia sp. NBRC 101731]GLY32760.1 beta-galactosidase [Kineosporia sp. NBRC 101731]
MSELTIGEKDFLLDGEPYQILSGALHYFRVHPDLWADRIHKARLMGLNTIETYVPWNAHSPSRGEFVTEGGLDLERFLKLVAAEGMHAIVRPGPYICAEWSNGGLPPWLLRIPGIGLRRSEPQYLEAVTEYLESVYRIVAPLQIDRGGPVFLVQIENEYGAYGCDKEYLAELVRVTRGAGITVPLNTIDQPQPDMLADGSLPGLHMTASFGSRSTERFKTLREFQPTGPLMCMEFWNGWFDSWGFHHHTTTVEDSDTALDEILSAGGSVNFYMFHGGTNFGMTNGANDKGAYVPLVTSYDYDAPLDEAGNPTAKYHAFRKTIAKYAPVPDEVPAEASAAPTVSVELTAGAGLLGLAGSLGEVVTAEHAATYEELAQDTGFVLYETSIGGRAPGVLTLDEVRDRAYVFVDGVPVGVLARDSHESSIRLPLAGSTLTILVEDQGRVNYGPRLGEEKGLIGEIRLGGEILTGWSARALDVDRLPELEFAGSTDHGPTVLTGEFDLDEPADLFLDTTAWGKGLAWVNGFNLGRYWRRGPSQTLYVPGPVTRAGRNRIVVLELEAMTGQTATFVDGLRLGQIEF